MSSFPFGYTRSLGYSGILLSFFNSEKSSEEVEDSVPDSDEPIRLLRLLGSIGIGGNILTGAGGPALTYKIVRGLISAKTTDKIFFIVFSPFRGCFLFPPSV